MAGLNIKELATSDISLSDYFAKADENGLATKNTIQGLANILDIASSSQFRGSLAIADTPTLDGWYFASETGTYTNAGSLVVDVSDNIVIIIVSDTQTTFSKVDVPITLTIDATPTTDSTNALQSGGAKNYIDAKVKNTFDATNEVDASSMKATADEINQKSLDEIKFYRDNEIYKSISFKQQDGNINKDTGATQISGTWRNTGFIEVKSNDIIKRTSLAYNNTGSGTVALLSYWDENKNFISSLIENAPATDTHTFENITGIKYIILSYTDASGITVELENTGIDIQKIDGITNIKDVTGVLREGYINVSGEFNSASTWRTSEDIQTKEGDIFYYSGYTTTGQPQVIGYDVSNNVTILLPYVNPDQLTRAKVVIPANIVRVVASSVADSVDFKLEKEVYLWGLEEEVIENFMPKNVYGKNGDVFKLNPFGILAKHPVNNNLDIFWNVDKSNEKQLIYTPSTETSKELFLNYNGNQLSTTLNVAQSPTNPANPHYFLHFGDSTVLGVSYASIEGAMVNELSRRLNGTGTALLSGAESPTADAFTNLQFIGTLGNQPVKHEGRGGWSLFNYLNTETLNSVTNAFYNPAVSKFDLDYYLTQNNFTNISASGDNLTIILQCTWNSVYKHTKAQLLGWLTEITDLILADKPSAKIVLVGVPNPAFPNKKTFTGTRDVSYEAIMKQAVLPFSKLYQNFAEDVNYTANVDYVDYASVFFPENSYPSIDEKISVRHSETYKAYTDYVHQNALGYAQMVDALYYYILNKYC